MGLQRRVSSYQAGLLCACAAFGALPERSESAPPSFGGDVTIASDSIIRGLSESNFHRAFQADLHMSMGPGLFAGAWGSTRDQNVEPGAKYDVELYAGKRIDFSTTWNATVTLTEYLYLGGMQDVSNDYQEISGSVSYLDRWTFTLTSSPNAVRYFWGQRVGRYASYIAETTGQWLIRDGLYLTGGAGYYLFTSHGRPGAPYVWQAQITAVPHQANIGYVYGNVGVAYERQAWRLDLAYFLTQHRSLQLFPYPNADDRIAGTLSYHF